MQGAVKQLGIVVATLIAFANHAAAAEGRGTSYTTETAKVEKVFSVIDDGHRFVAYQVSWKGVPVIVSDALAKSDFKAGDEIHFMASRHWSAREGVSGYTNLTFSLLPEPRARASDRRTPAERERSTRLARGDLDAAKTDFERFLALGPAATAALGRGDQDTARKLAKELEGKLHQHRHDGAPVHALHSVLGRIALSEGRLEEAERHLLESAASEGSPVLNSFGPDMQLAKELLEKGGKEVVLEYFKRCRKFWKMGGEKLDRWTKEVKAGVVPDFGANLKF